MKAIILRDFGAAENLELTDGLPDPEAREEEVLVQVKAVSINPVDVKTRNGKALAAKLKDFRPVILGWDIAGTIIRAGKGVSGFKAGDDVFGMINFPGYGKAYAEYVAAPAGQIALKPAGISFEQAAATTLAALTAWQALTVHYKISPGDKVFIHAASGGVGHFAVQIAKHFGAYVIGTSSAANRELVLSLGADEHIDYHEHKFEEVSPVVDFVLDTIGGNNIDRSLEIIRPGGSIISLPSGLSESVAEKAGARGIHGSHFMVSSNGNDMKSLAGLLSTGAIRPHIMQVFAFADMASAHRQVESGKTAGKVIVKI